MSVLKALNETYVYVAIADLKSESITKEKQQRLTNFGVFYIWLGAYFRNVCDS